LAQLGLCDVENAEAARMVAHRGQSGRRQLACRRWRRQTGVDGVASTRSDVAARSSSATGEREEAARPYRLACSGSVVMARSGLKKPVNS
jgi:hypothetical protein